MMKKIMVLCPWNRFSFEQKQKGFRNSMVYNNLRVFVKNGYEVHLILPKSKVPARMEGYEGINVHEFGTVDLPIVSNFVFRLFRRLVLYVSYVGLSTVALLKTIKKHGKPFVLYGYSSYAVPSVYLTSRLFKVDNVSRFFGTFLTPYLKSPFRMMLYNMEEVVAFKLPCKYMIITNDGAAGDIAAKTLGVPGERIKYWINGVDFLTEESLSKTEARNELQIDQRQHILVSVGRLVRLKGIDKIIRAMTKVDKATLLVIGNGEEKENLQKLAEKLWLKDRVKFLGALPHDAVRKYLYASDLFVKMQNGSNVSSELLEALTCGCCVVASDVGSTRNFINGKNGVLVDHENTCDLVNAINGLLADSMFRKELGVNASEFARENFKTWTERGKVELELIEGISA